MVNCATMTDYSETRLTIISYNCRGFNSAIIQYIASLFSICSILYIQEHWLAETQLSLLGNICSNVSYTGISGFNNSDILSGRPYGGCALLWHSDLLVNVSPINVKSNSICAAHVGIKSVNFLIIDVYMPFEVGDDKTDEFVFVLTLVENLIEGNGDCHIILGGDFNVDFTRDRTHTALLTSFVIILVYSQALVIHCATLITHITSVCNVLPFLIILFCLALCLISVWLVCLFFIMLTISLIMIRLCCDLILTFTQ